MVMEFLVNRTMRKITLGASLLACLLLAFVGYRLLLPGAAAQLPVISSLGGGLVLDSTLGRPIDLKDYRGKVVLLDFGYTFCPDICPTVLARLAQVLKGLGGDASQVQVIFVSFDPKRDTVEHLRQYLSFFDPRMIGATGSAGAIADATKHFGVTFVPRDMGSANYGFDHSDFIYLLDTEGHVRKLYDAEANTTEVQQDVQALLQEHSFWRRIF